MQGRSQDQRELLDVESVAGDLLAPGSVFAFLAEHRRRLFPAEMFEDLFPSGRGRPSAPPDVVATAIVLQTLHGFSDREAADAVTFDLRWKAACGIAVDAGSFHPSTFDVLASSAGGFASSAADLRGGPAGWSRWRRRHRARASHYRRQAASLA